MQALCSRDRLWTDVCCSKAPMGGKVLTAPRILYYYTRSSDYDWWMTMHVVFFKYSTQLKSAHLDNILSLQLWSTTRASERTCRKEISGSGSLQERRRQMVRSRTEEVTPPPPPREKHNQKYIQRRLRNSKISSLPRRSALYKLLPTDRQ